jgi:septum formation protein
VNSQPDRQPVLVLASSSPRRRQLLELIGVPFIARAAQIDEQRRANESPVEYALRTALEKVQEVARRGLGLPVLGADTVVEIGGRVLGKPSDRDEAIEMLRSLSDKVHQVHTAIALSVGDRSQGLVDTARVRFARLDADVIQWYVDTGEPMDKAGAYAVQGAGGMLVSSVEGSPHTVVGLPIHRLPELFARLNVDFWKLLGATG